MLTSGAGHETVATALTWGLYELARQPELQKEKYQELSAAGFPSTMNEIASLPKLDAVVVSPVYIRPADS